MFDNHCVICLESITDPICIHCYIRQVKTWFRDIDINPVIKKYALNKIKQKLSIEGVSDIGCIICGNENADICFYCFGFITINILKELSLPDEMLESFSESFNYNLMERDIHSGENHEDFNFKEDNLN